MPRRTPDRAPLPRPAPVSTRVDTARSGTVGHEAPGVGQVGGGGGRGAGPSAPLRAGTVAPSSSFSQRAGETRVYLNQSDGGPGDPARQAVKGNGPRPLDAPKRSGKRGLSSPSRPLGAPEELEGDSDGLRDDVEAGAPRSVEGSSARSGQSPSGAGRSEAASDGRERIEAGRNAYESLIALCRHDVNAFNEFVLRDEETREPIEQAPMHVEMQDAYDRHGFVVVLAHPESGKTQQLGVGRTLFELGRNPDLRVVFLNNTQDGGVKTLRSAKKYLERSEELRAVFPHLKPGGLWREDSITVERKTFSKDPSIYCLGFHGNILGARIDRAVVDDLLDFENTRTEAARRDASSWFKRTFLTRLSKQAKLAFLTNAWHEEDLAHELENDGWKVLRYPVLDDAGQSTWPTQWPLARIAEWRARLGELEFTRMFLCRPRDPGAEVFGAELLARTLRNGRGYGLVRSLDDSDLPPGAFVVTGVDLGASKKMTGGFTAMYSVLFYPTGTRQLVGARSGRWSGPGILRNIAEVGDLYGGTVVVEDNGVQRYLREIAEEEGDTFDLSVPVLPFYTGRNKYDMTLGIDAMAAEMEGGRWRIPSGRSGRPDPRSEVGKLIGELRAYAPNSHPGDRLMALWFARTWGMQRLARMRRGRERPGGVRVSVIGG